MDNRVLEQWLSSGDTPRMCPFLRGYCCLRASLCGVKPAVYSCDDSVFKSRYVRLLNLRKEVKS